MDQSSQGGARIMILHRYLARKFLLAFLVVFAIFSALSLMIDFMEHIRKFSGLDQDIWAISKLVSLAYPSKIYEIVPLIMVISSIAAFLSLSRTSELVIARSAGRSALRFLAGPILTVLTLGVGFVAVMNPIVAGTSKQYESAVAQTQGDSANLLSVSANGIWLRQAGGGEQILIRATQGSLDGTVLTGVTFLVFDTEGHPQKRIEADAATLNIGSWDLRGVYTWDLNRGTGPAQQRVRQDVLTIPTNLTLNQIRDSFGAPSAISIWKLPAFIGQLENAGFSARRHTVWFQMQIALPAFLLAVALIGAAFTIAPSRVQNSGMMVLTAVICGFGLYFVRNFAKLLAENGQLDPGLAAWVPPLAAIGLALAMILQREDG
ncbi:MAG: LPS export ABC transporter permease LptG [Planktomarina sp.]